MSFQQGLSGLDAATKNLDIIGNNVANANTVGYKSAAAEFADVFASSVGGDKTQVGIGTSISAVKTNFAQGNITVSNNPLDLAINGQGFYRLDTQGVISYTRNGQFSLDKNGYIVNSAGDNLTGYAAGANGVVSTASFAMLQVSTAQVSANPTTSGTIQVNLDAKKALLPAAGFLTTDPSTYSDATSLTVFDSLGDQHIMSVYFQKTAANVWDVYAAGDGVQIGATSVGQIGFLPDGSLDPATTTFPAVVNVPASAGAAVSIAVNLDFTGTTQFGNSFSVNQLTQDGYSSGSVAGYSVTPDGMIMARYTNGQTRQQGQVILANFKDPGGLAQLGANHWVETQASGQPLPGPPGTSDLGVIQAGALEESNVDLTAALVAMITAQRVYQANAQTIKSQDEVLQTMLNMK